MRKTRGVRLASSSFHAICVPTWIPADASTNTIAASAIRIPARWSAAKSA